MEFVPHIEEGESLSQPVIHLPLDIGQVACSWMNTRLRLFSNNPQFDHIEVVSEEGKVIGFQDDDTMQLMKDRHYPAIELPFVDESTWKWMFDHLTDSLDDELGGLAG